MDLNVIYITTRDKEEAKLIGKALVEARLAACANIIDGMSSIYWWKGKIEYDTEAVLILKTRRDLVPTLTETVKSLHSYECPCVVSLPIQDGNPAYLKWIEDMTSE